MLKHGFENFKWEVLKECISQEELDYYEDFYIKEFNSLDRKLGYNLKSGGKFGCTYTDEIKKKIGITTKLKWQNVECAEKMREGLRKGTAVVKEKAKLNFVDFECPHCHKIIKVKPFELKIKKYCSHECAVEAESENRMKALDKANAVNLENFNTIKLERFEKIIQWLKNNKDLVMNCKLNNLVFLNDLCSYIEVKDARTLAKVLDVKNKKETIVKLKELIKMYAVPSDE